MVRIAHFPALFALLCLAVMPARAESAKALPAAEICGYLTTEAERLTGIPAQLLTAIGLAESGRYDEHGQARVAWPWTIYAEGKGRYLPSREIAVAEVKRLRDKGVTNIDVGCMQVNLGYHGENFTSIEHALDPIANVAYAAVFLKELHQENRSWTRAIAYYHSRTPERYRKYAARVMALWAEARRDANEARRLRTQEEYKTRMAERRAKLRRVDQPNATDKRHLKRIPAQ
ncbi:MAG: transglycosylase SLT domain-containing protein [Alphaproteobacteria bacterium]